MERKTIVPSALGLAVALLAGPSVAGPAAAADQACLTGQEQRSAIRTGDAVRPAAVQKSVDGEVLRLSLCTTADGLVYYVTVLKRDGRVSNHAVDARTGQLLW